MCGIFGGVGPNVSPAILRALAWANITRGKDATGFFNKAADILKKAKPSDEMLRLDDVTKFIEQSCLEGMCIGHTRHGTRGSNTDDNAHPFQYGTITGVHNGMVDAPTNYSVDSMYIFDQLNQHNGDYQEALKNVFGYMAVAWYDGMVVKLLAHEHYCHYGRIGPTVYFSSEATPLEMLGVRDVKKLEDSVISIDEFGIVRDLPKLEGLKYVESDWHGYYSVKNNGPQNFDIVRSSVWVNGVQVNSDTLFVLKFVPLQEIGSAKSTTAVSTV